MKYFIANWKANKNQAEAIMWVQDFLKRLEENENLLAKIKSGHIKIIICPPSPLLLSIKKLVCNKNIYLGSQDVSSVEEGKYTGEVTARSLSGIAEFAIVGHSERRKNFNDNSDQAIIKKINMCHKYMIEPILCIRDTKDYPGKINKIVAFEPESAIGTGNNEDVKKVVEQKKLLHLENDQIFLYGGSVNESDIHSYLNSQEINGLLIGSASLNPKTFYNLVNSV